MSKIKPIDIIDTMSGKVCEHSDMYFRTNKQTGDVFTGKLCNPSTAAPTEAQIKAKERFAKVAEAVRAIMADPEQRSQYETGYKAQHTIGSLFGYIFAKINDQYDENGEKTV